MCSIYYSQKHKVKKKMFYPESWMKSEVEIVELERFGLNDF